MAAREYKLILAGEGGVGKTTWLRSVRGGGFCKAYVPTLGVDIRTLWVDTEAESVMFHICDLAGQDKFGGDRPSYYKDAHAALIFHDLSSTPTFHSVGEWIASIRKVCPNIPIFIVGTKMDAYGANRRVLQDYDNFTMSSKHDSLFKQMEPLMAVIDALE